MRQRQASNGIREARWNEAADRSSGSAEHGASEPVHNAGEAARNPAEVEPGGASEPTIATVARSLTGPGEICGIPLPEPPTEICVAPASSVSLHAAYPLVGGADVEMHAPDINMEIQTPSQNQTQLNAFSNDRIGPLSEAEAECLQERKTAWLESLESRGFVMGLPEAKRKGLLPMGFQPGS